MDLLKKEILKNWYSMNIHESTVHVFTFLKVNLTNFRRFFNQYFSYEKE